jgi:hypothetical protein
MPSLRPWLAEPALRILVRSPSASSTANAYRRLSSSGRALLDFQISVQGVRSFNRFLTVVLIVQKACGLNASCLVKLARCSAALLSYSHPMAG